MAETVDSEGHVGGEDEEGKYEWRKMEDGVTRRVYTNECGDEYIIRQTDVPGVVERYFINVTTPEGKNVTFFGVFEDEKGEYIFLNDESNSSGVRQHHIGKYSKYMDARGYNYISRATDGGVERIYIKSMKKFIKEGDKEKKMPEEKTNVPETETMTDPPSLDADFIVTSWDCFKRELRKSVSVLMTYTDKIEGLFNHTTKHHMEDELMTILREAKSMDSSMRMRYDREDKT